MPEEKFIEYELLDGSIIMIESDLDKEARKRSLGRGRESIGASHTKFDSAFNPVKQVLNSLKKQLKETDSDEIEITFGIKPGARFGAFVICQGSAESNFTVRLKWKR